MMLEKTSHRAAAVAVSLAGLLLITVVAKHAAGFNAITVALLYLLVVLTTAALAGFAAGMTTATASGLLVNFYFLPPFGTFYIASPEDWGAFAAYTATAVVVSRFAAAVSRRTAEIGRLQEQLPQLGRFVDGLVAVRREDLTLMILLEELRKTYGWEYCALYLFGTGAAPVSAGTRPSQAAALPGRPVPPPGTILDLICEEMPDVCRLTVTDHQGTVVGALVAVCRIPPSREAAAVIAGLVSLLVGHCGSAGSSSGTGVGAATQHPGAS